MNQRLRVAIIWVVGIVSIAALIFEFYALLTGNTTLSRLLRQLAEAYRPVDWMVGIITGFLLIIALVGTFLPSWTRFCLLVWLMVFAHIFWPLC